MTHWLAHRLHALANWVYPHQPWAPYVSMADECESMRREIDAEIAAQGDAFQRGDQWTPEQIAAMEERDVRTTRFARRERMIK